MKPLLSVLIPSIPRRMGKLSELMAALEAQKNTALEVLVLMDNYTRPVGHKRNALTEIARGEFVCYVDDDELVEPGFVDEITGAIGAAALTVDLIAYDAKVTIDLGAPFRVKTAMGNPVQGVQVRADGGYDDIVRPPWHWCAWRRELAAQTAWPDFYYGDDWDWLSRMYPQVREWVKIDKMLFHHRFSTTDSSGSHEFKSGSLLKP